MMLLAALAAGCASADDKGQGPAFVDADADRAITANELTSTLGSRLGVVDGAALVSACDAFPHDGKLSAPGEFRCLESRPVGGGSSLPVQDALQRPILAPGPGWLTLLFIGLGVAVVSPVFADRVVRAAGWRFRKKTGGAWFRLHPASQLSLSLLAGLSVATLAVLLLILLHVPAARWYPLAAFVSIPLPPWEIWGAFLRATLWPVLALIAAGGLLALIRGVGTTSASRRLLDLTIVKGREAGAPDGPRTRPKNIVICCDGTGNQPGTTEGGHSTISNVAKFYDLVVPADRSGWGQSKWYDAGVGTETSGASRRLSFLGRAAAWVAAHTPVRMLGIAEKVRRILELGFGIGITENISQAYREIVRQYEPGDRIFLIGFSRGAYTARCLADMIDDIGLLRPEFIRYAPDIVQFYRYRNSTAQTIKLDPAVLRTNVDVEFLGLWDTVASLGVPLWGWSYTIGGLWSNQGMGVTEVRNCRVVRHALSIDEERSQFMLTLFDEGRAEAAGTDIQQRWFRGSHAGVGGGYADSALADIPLTWIIEEAEARGLVFASDWRATLTPNSIGLIITQLERQRVWRLGGTWPRWHPCGSGSTGFGTLAPSVVERAKHARSLRASGTVVGSDELLMLAPGESARVRIRGDYTWHRTGVVMEQGARYRITYVDGKWRDKEADPCGPDGQKATGFDLRRILGAGKRCVDGQWMELIGHVAHPRHWPQRELDASTLLRHLFWEDPPELTQSLIPLGRHLARKSASVEVEVQAPAGMFYAFANDWWLFYDNNSGAVMLEITRLPGDEPHSASYYRVDESGSVSGSTRAT